MAPGSDVQLQQLTPWARAGHTVLSLNYPLAPWDRFPAALLSTLKAFSFLRSRKGIRHLKVVGESAGANLGSMAAGASSCEET